jgi:predicted enzyme related to lactoylglutathione lyase
MINNALASVAVRNLDEAVKWYERIFQRPASRPMPAVAEWSFSGGGALQLYQLPERSGSGSFTLAVRDLENEVKRLRALRIEGGEQTSSALVKTWMITDPDGNHIALAEALHPQLAR